MTQHHSNPERASDAHALPRTTGDDPVPETAGTYLLRWPTARAPSQYFIADYTPGRGWWPTAGPFATEAEALADARKGRGDA
jgi:hypothetical protein